MHKILVMHSVARDDPDACANQTRMCIGGGYSTKNDIEFITIASTGNGVDFGDLTVGRTVGGACGSSVRGMWTGGTTAPALLQDVIDYITISTTGNAQDFGDLTGARSASTSASNSTRGVTGGGIDPSNSTTIEFLHYRINRRCTRFWRLDRSKTTCRFCSITNKSSICWWIRSIT